MSKANRATKTTAASSPTTRRRPSATSTRWAGGPTGGSAKRTARQLVVRDLFYDAQTSRQFGLIAQHSLAQIGVKLELMAKAGSGFFTNYINVGAFDIAQFGWMGDAFPLSALTQIYASTGESNFGKIGSPEIDAKIEQTLEELDPAKARVLANEVDTLIWAEGFSLPLVQSPGNVAVNSSLANFGAAGLGRPRLHRDRVHALRESASG